MHHTSSRGLEEVAREERDITKHLTANELFVIRRALARQMVQDLKVVEGERHTVTFQQGVGHGRMLETLNTMMEL